MLRTFLWCVILRGCALGDVAATGTSILWMLALHGSTVASCRAFSMLVMLGLDERSFSLEGKVLLCAAVAMAPLFPPRKASADYMREVREFRAQHGSDPVETPGSAGYALATCIRKARAKRIFNAAELAELDSEIPAPAAAPKKPVDAVAAAARVPQPRSNTEIERTSGGTAPSTPSCGHATTDLRENCEACQRYFRQMETAVLGMAVTGSAQDWGAEVLDDPLASGSHAEIERTSSATGQEGEEASAPTGEADGGSTTSCAGLGATLSLPGLNINWPFSQLILAGVKTVEKGPYALGKKNIARPKVCPSRRTR